MFMPVMKIGHMRMRMLSRFVIVLVYMPDTRRNTLVNMIMVGIVMAVRVYMPECMVRMCMLMMLRDHQRNPGNHGKPCDYLDSFDRLP